MPMDAYAEFAERYDWMVGDDPFRRGFFERLVARHRVKKVLDCACGTGHDLLMLHSLGCDVCGSDLSEAMLAQARHRLAAAGITIPLLQADFCHLRDKFDMEFDAVLCLTNSINEVLTDEQTRQALSSMRSVLRDGGVLVFDQGQTDASMANPPKYDLVANNRDWTRFFALEYSADVMTVNVFDFLHTEETSDYRHFKVLVRIRFQNSWASLLQESGFASFEFFEDWKCSPYNKTTSRRLIAVATK